MTNTGCEEVRLELPTYARSGRPADADSVIDRHVRGCATCREELLELQRLEELLDAHLPAMIPSTTFASTFANRLAAQVLAEGETASRSGFGAWFRPWLIPLGAGAALAVMVVHQVVTMDQERVARGPEPAVEAPGETGVTESVQVARSGEKPSARAGEGARDEDDGETWALAGPPPEVLDRLDLFVDYAVIEHLDRLEAAERAG